MCKILVEIWHEILDLATVIEYGDEFGQSDISDTALTIEKRNLKCLIPPKEEHRAFKNRLNIFLVCQVWYTVALWFLYEGS